MRGRIRYLIYALAAYALYRLWPTRGFVWWTLLASALLTLWTAAMLKTAVKRRAAGDLAAALNPRLSVPGSAQGPTGRSLLAPVERGAVRGHGGPFGLGDRRVRLSFPWYPGPVPGI